jgi:hypothetical protein
MRGSTESITRIFEAWKNFTDHNLGDFHFNIPTLSLYQGQGSYSEFVSKNHIPMLIHRIFTAWQIREINYPHKIIMEDYV